MLCKNDVVITLCVLGAPKWKPARKNTSRNYKLSTHTKQKRAPYGRTIFFCQGTCIYKYMAMSILFLCLEWGIKSTTEHLLQNGSGRFCSRVSLEGPGRPTPPGHALGVSSAGSRRCPHPPPPGYARSTPVGMRRSPRLLRAAASKILAVRRRHAWQ